MNKINGANLGFEEKLWKTADKLRSNMDASQYKHVVLGLIFLKYLSDVFQEQQLKFQYQNKNSEDKSLYIQSKLFWIPEKARWDFLHLKRMENNNVYSLFVVH